MPLVSPKMTSGDAAFPVCKNLHHSDMLALLGKEDNATLVLVPLLHRAEFANAALQSTAYRQGCWQGHHSCISLPHFPERSILSAQSIWLRRKTCEGLA